MIEKVARRNIIGFLESIARPIEREAFPIMARETKHVEDAFAHIKKMYPNSPKITARFEKDSRQLGPRFVSSGKKKEIKYPIETNISRKRVAAASLPYHEYGHGLIFRERLYRNPKFVELFDPNRKGIPYSSAKEWDATYPPGNEIFLRKPNLKRKDYLDVGGTLGYTEPGYATLHPEEEAAETIAAILNPRYKIKYPEGKAGEIVKQKVEFMTSILNKYKHTSPKVSPQGQNQESWSRLKKGLIIGSAAAVTTGAGVATYKTLENKKKVS